MTVVIVAAMAEEAGAVLAHVTDAAEQAPLAGQPWWRGSLDGRPVAVVQGGIGLVNAASSLTAALHALRAADAPAELVVSAGTAGGLGEQVEVGDVIVAERVVHADVDVTVFGYALGQVPRMPDGYEAPPELVAAAESIAGDVVRIGDAVSTDAFVIPGRARRILADFPDTLFADMETSALAQVAFRHEVDFVAVRGISDLADGGEFSAHVDDAAERSARVLAALLSSRG